MWTTIVELEFYHLPAVPSEVPHVASAAGNGYLLWMRDGSLKHAYCAEDHFATQDGKQVPDDLICAWAALARPIAECTSGCQ